MSNHQQYAEPVYPGLPARNASERDELQKLIDNPATPWPTRTNATARLGELQRQSESQRLDREVQRRSEQCRAGEEIIASNGHVLIQPCTCGRHHWVE